MTTVVARVTGTKDRLPSMRRVSLALLACCALLLTAASCKKKGVVVGSCDRRSTDKAQSVCNDAFSKTFILDRCSVEHGETQAAGKVGIAPCDRRGALAGCKSEDAITWMFPSKDIRTVGNVAYVCPGTLVGVDGVELKGVAKVKTLTPVELDAEVDIPKMKPKIEPILAMVEQIGKRLPPPTKKAVPVPNDLGDNVISLQAEDLASPGVLAPLAHRAAGTGVLSTCARIIRKNDLAGVTDVYAALRPCANAKALVVVRLTSLQEPKSVTGLNSYQAGHASGDVLVFDLTSGKLVGAAPFTAKSSSDISTTWKEFESGLQKDFDKQLDAAWSSAGRAAIPKGNAGI